MKKTLFALMILAASTMGIVSCADLGFGVDVDSSGASPYWYGNGWMGDTYWNTPVWNYGPIYNPRPPAPPLIGNGPGSIGRPPRPIPRPPQNVPSVPSAPSVPNTVGGIQRPGNGGLPNPSTIPTGRPINNGSNNSSRR